MSHYLKGNIDFSAFYILDVIPQNKENAVVLLAPIICGEYSYFNLQYKDNSLWYGTIENMMEHCVHNRYISRLKAKILIHRYYKNKTN